MDNSQNLTKYQIKYHSLKLKGICTRCRYIKATKGYTTCQKCRVNERNRMNEYHSYLKLSGLCVLGCGNYVGDGNFILCLKCRLKRFERYWKNKSNVKNY